MPELPEVETIVRELRRRILDRPLKQARLLRPDMLISPSLSSDGFGRYFRGRSFTGVDRRGKYLIFTLSSGSRLLAHLGMTGKFIVANGKADNPNYLCSQYLFADGLRLDHLDVRRFGSLALYPPGDALPALQKLGAEPLDRGFGAENLRVLIFDNRGRRRQRAIHPLLLDQSLIAGVGNIYASEALFRAGIRPQRKATKIHLAELEGLARELKDVLKLAIRLGGTTVSDYRRVDDQPGRFRKLLQVYDREGEPCRRCQTPIKRIRLGGRSAFFCPHCQK